jgi:hypothetical protein
MVMKEVFLMKLAAVSQIHAKKPRRGAKLGFMAAYFP